MTDYSFFERSCEAARTYRLWASDHREYVELPAVRPHVEVLSGEEDDYRVRTRHLMFEPSPVGLALVNERLNVTLPRDMDDFYRRWGGGLLMFREFYKVYDPQEIIEHTLSLRNEPEPVRVVRFCRFMSGHEFLFRLSDAGRWELFMTESVQWDREVLHWDRAHDGESGDIEDASFRDWLKRLCDTEGWPPSPNWDEEPDWLAERLDTVPPEVAAASLERRRQKEEAENPPERAVSRFACGILFGLEDLARGVVVPARPAEREYVDAAIDLWLIQAVLFNLTQRLLAGGTGDAEVEVGDDDVRAAGELLRAAGIRVPQVCDAIMDSDGRPGVDIHGDEAAVRVPDPRVPPLRVRKVDRGWRVVLAAPPGVADLPAAVDHLKRLSEETRDIARDVYEGDLTTPQELGERLKALPLARAGVGDLHC